MLLALLLLALCTQPLDGLSGPSCYSRRDLLPDGALYTFDMRSNKVYRVKPMRAVATLIDQKQVDVFMKRAPVADILWLFLGTRLLLIAITYFSYILFPVPPHLYPNTGIDVAGLFNSWNHWDAQRFVEIAQYGYQSAYDTPFFPLLPLLIKGVALLCGNQGYLAIRRFQDHGQLAVFPTTRGNRRLA